MGIFESVKRVFNVGGCGIAIRLADAPLRQGDTVAGSVLLTGGDYAQQARELRIGLVEFWTESRGSGKHRRTVTVTHEADAAVLASPCSLAAGETRELPYSLRLPPDARLAASGGSTGWRLTVAMDIPGAVDPSGSQDLEVGPATALLELVDLWQEVLRWSEVPGNRRWDRGDRTTCFRLRPPSELQAEFDHLDLACRPLPDGDWHAALKFDLQEKSFLDRLKALIDIDKAKRGLRIPGAALSGDPAARATCAKHLVGLMQEIINLRTTG